ncbi:MAG TPA: hypothetical protein VIV84_04170 [Burkholderiaceae bacterium]|jgi:hypothetical protein
MSAKAITAIGLLLCVGVAVAQDKAKKTNEEAKEVSGMSIVGNSETPKSLTIIPWKSSEIGRDADFKSALLNQEIVPIDKPTFLRGLDFYKLSNRN